MSRIISLGTMIKQLHGLCGTPDVNTWEDDFISSCYGWSKQGTDTRGITAKQIPIIERLYWKHFS